MLKKFYMLALAEGEGLGTAYEYAAKYELLKHHTSCKKALIYGLPQKYGFSLDFLHFLDSKGCKIHVYEKRKEKVLKYDNIIKTLLKKGLIKQKPLIINKVERNYDLVLSCEVIQTFDKEKLQEYLGNVEKFSKASLIFFPNKHNKLHTLTTKLKSLSPEHVSSFFRRQTKAGFVDMPPFPPGLGLKSNKMRNNLGLLMPLLSVWLLIEKACPNIIKKRFCHIAYIRFEKQE